MRKYPQTIPEYIRPHLSADVIKQLEEDGHGISYPDHRGVQTRARRFKECIDSGYFAYSQYDSIQDAILAAMARTQRIRIENPVIRSKVGNVRYIHHFDYRRGMMGERIQVDYKKEDGREARKTFSFGYIQQHQSKLIHGLRTGHLFRAMFEEFGNDMDFDYFRKWKTRKLYEDEKPFAW